MNSRTKTTVYLLAIAAAAILVWAGAGPLWRLLLAMHGIHQH
jgi:hypothetical protein